MAHAGKQYKQDAAWIAKSQIKKPLDGPLSLVISAYPPDRRRRDLDGLLKITQDLLEGVP